MQRNRLIRLIILLISRILAEICLKPYKAVVRKDSCVRALNLALWLRHRISFTLLPSKIACIVSSHASLHLHLSSCFYRRGVLLRLVRDID